MELKPAMIEFREEPKKLKPGIYQGARGVASGVPTPWQHEYLVAIPKDKEKLSRRDRRRLKKIGPNGEKGYVIGAQPHREGKIVQAGFKRSKLKATVNADKNDINHARSGELRRLKTNNINRSTERALRYADEFKARKYPNPLANAIGMGKNSNTFVRSAIDDIKVRGVDEESRIRRAGSKQRFSELRPAMIEFKRKDDEERYNPHKIDIYEKNDDSKLNQEEKGYRQVRKAGPYIAGAMNGAAIGGTLTGGNPVGALAGAAAGAATNRGLRAAAEKKGDDRRPMTGAVVSGTLPALAVAAPFVRKKFKKAKPPQPKKKDSKPLLGLQTKGNTTDFKLKLKKIIRDKNGKLVLRKVPNAGGNIAPKSGNDLDEVYRLNRKGILT